MCWFRLCQRVYVVFVVVVDDGECESSRFSLSLLFLKIVLILLLDS